MSHIRFPNVELNVSTGEITPVSGEAAPKKCNCPVLPGLGHHFTDCPNAAPTPELPKMTAAHVYALNWIRREWLDVPEPEISNETRRFHEIAANIAAQVSGEAKLVPTATHRAVSVEDLTELLLALDAAGEPNFYTHKGMTNVTKEIVRRWRGEI